MGISVKSKLVVGGIAAAAAGALAATALAGAGVANAATNAPSAVNGSGNYQYVNFGSTKDVTFNQLLGINNNGRIAGYFGSGAAGHPNKGYTITAPYAQNDIASENFPHSVQTQVTGLNDDGVQVGFYSTQNTASMSNNNFGWYFNGSFHKVDFPTTDNSKPPVNQLLGVNDHDVAVGFYNNGATSARAYEYNIKTHKFTRVQIPGYPTGSAGPSTTATAINNNGNVAGFYTDKAGVTVSFLDRNGKFTTLAFPGASSTNASGLNDHDEVVGFYMTGSGSSALTHGFTWTPSHGFATIDDPNGVGATTVNGVNDEGDLVGFYTDSAGNTIGMVAFPNF
jgi:hypothetical protein